MFVNTSCIFQYPTLSLPINKTGILLVRDGCILQEEHELQIAAAKQQIADLEARAAFQNDQHKELEVQSMACAL